MAFAPRSILLTYSDIDIAIFRFFKMAAGLVWAYLTTHEGFLLVFITVQNLVAIDLVVLKIRKFEFSHVWLENAYSQPQNRGLGEGI